MVRFRSNVNHKCSIEGFISWGDVVRLKYKILLIWIVEVQLETSLCHKRPQKKKKSNSSCFYTPMVLKLLIIVQMKTKWKRKFNHNNFDTSFVKIDQVLDSIGIPNFSVFTGIKLIPIPPVYVFAKNRYTESVFCIGIELCVPVLCSCFNEFGSRCTPKIAVLEDIFYSLATESHHSAHQPWISSPFLLSVVVVFWIMLFVIQAIFNAVIYSAKCRFHECFRISKFTQKLSAPIHAQYTAKVVQSSYEFIVQIVFSTTLACSWCCAKLDDH